jgi:DNA-binding response OmpR family regulator
MAGWILIIEDEAEIQTTIQQWLVQAGFKVVCSSSVHDAIGKLGKQHFDCVLLDLNLGRGSGEEIISFIREQADTNERGIPILVMSGALKEEVVRKICRQVNDMLVKPFRAPLLLERINKLLPDKGRPDSRAMQTG